MTRIALYGNTYQSSHIEKIDRFIAALTKLKDTEVSIERSFGKYLCEAGCRSAEGISRFDEARENATLAVSFGGDGTFLSAAGMIGRRETPLLGVNTGHLGYLAATDIDSAPIIIDCIAAGAYIVEHRTMLEVSGDAIPANFNRYALNEVAILKANSASMITIDTALDGSPLAVYKADGLIISTPTGSTAYNLSVGGPIVDPGTDVWVISPVAPHTLTMRPLVVNDGAVLTATAESRNSTFRLSIDGRSVSLPTGTELRISKAPFDTLLARLPGVSYLDTLRGKLLWGQ